MFCVLSTWNPPYVAPRGPLSPQASPITAADSGGSILVASTLIAMFHSITRCASLCNDDRLPLVQSAPRAINIFFVCFLFFVITASDLVVLFHAQRCSEGPNITVPNVERSTNNPFVKNVQRFLAVGPSSFMTEQTVHVDHSQSLAD